MPRQKLALLGQLRWLRVSSLWVYRVLTWSVLVLGLAFAGVVIALRYWILPDIENYREDIARIVSERAHQKITIGRISANWDGLRPQLVLEQITVFDATGRAALELERIDNTLSWLSLPTFELRFYALDIYRPTLNIQRDPNGVVSIGGVEVTGGGGGGGFAAWLLRQRDVEVHGATIVWNDEQRAAPQLELKDVHFQLYNRGSRHRFAVRATPPRTLAAPLDLRGDFTGRSVSELAGWNGELFMQLDYVDIAAWRTWVPFPVQFPRGAGALRAWLTFSEQRLVEAVADVRLANVLTRLAEDLPQLELKELAGRVGWRQSEREFEISTSSLGLTTTGGLKLPPTDFLFRLAAGDKPRGEMRANALELAPLVALASHLPLADTARKELAEYSPKGGLYDMVMRWKGDWRSPQEYSVRGRFRNLVLNRVGKIPGFTGVSGTVEASERGGTLSLSSRKASVDMPMVFREPHEFDALTAQVAWSRGRGETELRLNNVSFSNAHLAGTVSGIYRTVGPTAGDIDLTGSLSRANASFVSRYIPLGVGEHARAWLDTAFVAGRSTSVQVRLKGNLDQFPFPDSKNGVFQVTAKVSGGTLHYADGWPRIENIAGDLEFRGQRMEVRARQGTIYGVRLSRVQVEIPDLMSEGRTLGVRGDAEGPTADFLAYIEKSPVSAMIDRFTEGWVAHGGGRLALKLSIPLGDLAKTTVSGTYQFSGNTVTVSPDLPAVEQAGGRVEFTESGVRVPSVAGVALGGPVAITALTASDSTVRVSINGRVNTDGARRSIGLPWWARNVRGTTDWRAQVNAHRRGAVVTFESSLQGLAVDLPAPLVKTAAETLPVRFERRWLADNQYRLSLAIGDIVGANLLQRVDGKRATITRGNVRFGGAATAPDRNGVWVTGTMKALDVGRWFAFFGQAGGDTRVEWGGIDVKVGRMDALDRQFGELAIGAAFQGGQWRAAVAGKDLDGTLTWQPQGYGKLTARMKTLTIPAADSPDDRPTRKDIEQPPPALDIVAEQFINKDKVLGRLELSAVPEGRDWRIEHLRLTNPESTFTLDGLWQIGPVRPRTQVNLSLEASDVGKLLTRLGYPEGVRRGTSKLEGAVSWAGAPYDIDNSTLTGGLTLTAAKGQFVKLEPGIAKLLGILSLQALPRRATLDFRDVFSEGFAFDEIAGVFKINSGVAVTEKFHIQGPAATVVMLGEIDLAHETQNLKVRIAPQVSETVALGTALVGGPVIGIAAYLAQKVFKDPLGRFVAFEYSVTGSWSEPNVTRTKAPPAPPATEHTSD